jgi:hypothetical protein
VRCELLAACSLAVVAATLAPTVATAATSRASVDVDAGGLSADGPVAMEMPSVRLTGPAVTVEASVGPFQVMDTRPASPGWTLVAVASRPQDARGVAMEAPLVISPRLPEAPGGSGLVLGPDGPLDAPRAILTAPPGTGTGLVQVVPTLRLTVPRDAPSGSYTATLVVTVS